MAAMFRPAQRLVPLVLVAALLFGTIVLVVQRWSDDGALLVAPPPSSPQAVFQTPALPPRPADRSDDGALLVALPPSSPQAVFQTPALPPMPADDEAMAAALFHYLENPELCCHKLTMFGGIQYHGGRIDGDKFVCLDAGHAPPPGACLVYSVGISNEWSFDKDITRYGCQVHAFDPSMTKYNREVTEFGAKFYKIGLGGRTEVRRNGWHMMTLTDIRQKLGHAESDIHYLKVDIEGSEWDWLEQDAASLRGVHQLGMEVHMHLSMPKLRRHYAVFEAVQGAGFKLIHSNPNRVYGRGSRVAGVADKVGSLYELVWMRA